MRKGLPSSSTSKSLGLTTKPKGGPGMGVLGRTCPSLPAGLMGGGIGFGNGGL